MMAVSLDDLLTDLTPEGLYADFVEIAKAVGVSTTAWQPGEPIRGFAAILCRWFVAVWNKSATPALRAMFLEYASGSWLTLMAWTMYRVYRRGMTFAGGTVVLENREGGFWTIAPGDVRLVHPESGKTYGNVTGGTLANYSGSGAYPTLELDFVAEEAGSGSDAPGGTFAAYPVAPLETPGPGIYARTNAEAFIGQDEQGDDSLKEDCRLSTGPLSPAGPKASYEFVARRTRVPDGTEPERLLVEKDGDVAANVTRVLVRSLGGGQVSVHLASAGGAATGDTATPGTDVYLVNQAIQILCVPLGFTATVEPATELATTAQALTVLVDRKANITAADALTRIMTAGLAWFSTFPIGGRKLEAGGQGYLFWDDVKRVILAACPGAYHVAPDSIPNIEVGATDVVLPAFEITIVLVTQ